MGRIKLDTLTDLARHGYDLRITCMACSRVHEVRTLRLLKRIIGRRGSTRIKTIEERMRCHACGERQASIQPILADL